MLKNALQYLVGLKETEVMEINGQQYSTKALSMVKDPAPEKLKTRTLTALVDYLKSGIDKKSSENLLVHVLSPTRVALQSELRNDKERENYMICETLTPENIMFDRFIGTEEFNIMLQSSFIDCGDRSVLLRLVGNIKDEAVQQVGDDGVSQAVTMKTGVASVDDVLVPNPVTLAPYRTFPEIEQPESKFIFRMQSGPRAALFEADGGAWRNEAMANIKKYLEENLVDLEFVHVIS